MRPLPLAAMTFCLINVSAHALPLSPVATSPGEQCRQAIVAAERGHAIPPQLLASIGRVESGRRDSATGIRGAWPWTINAEGRGYYFETKAEAIQTVEGLRARGIRSIDVGCMQVNLMYHPTAFTSLDMAFEPAVNADYAARFLLKLYGQTGDWTKATANYHSANPVEGGPYAEKVTSVWPEEQRKAGMAPPVPSAAGQTRQTMTSTPPFPGRQPARLFAMAGMPPMMMPPGTSPLSPVPQSQGVGPTGTPAPNRIGTSGTGSPAGMFGQPPANAGRTLDYYRSTPIRRNTPFQPLPRLPNVISMK
jgi:hypothetical protein